MKNRLPIVYFSDCLFFAGCENMIANFLNSKELAKKYSIFFLYRKSDSYIKVLKARVSGKYKSQTFSFIEPSNINYILRFFLTPLILIYEIIYLYFLFKKLRPFILHINNGGYPGALSARASAIAGKLASIPNIVMIVNNLAISYSYRLRFIDYPLDFFVKLSVDYFITGSLAAAKRLEDVLNVNHSKIRSIHNGVQYRMLLNSKDFIKEKMGLRYFKGVVFGMVALLVKRKGHLVLFESILYLSKNKVINKNNFILFIEGDGPEKLVLTRYVQDNNLEHLVKFIGNEKSIFDFMSILDVFVLPSIQDEDFPNVILEAMSLGIPVIGSNLAGISEQIVDNETGVLVKPNNPVLLSNAIKKLMQQPLLRSKMRINAKNKYKKQFTEKLAIKRYIKFYENLSLNLL